MAEAGLNELYDAVARSKKYTRLCDGLIRRICSEEYAKHGRQAERVKAVKTRLHAIYGAFLKDGDLKKMAVLFEGYEKSGDEQTGDESQSIGFANETGGLSHVVPQNIALATSLLKLHASTAERLGNMDAFFPFIFAHTRRDVKTGLTLNQGVGGSAHTNGNAILDLGCGLNPFAIPFMPVAPSVYHAVDIDKQTALYINKYIKLLGLSDGCECICADILADAPFHFKHHVGSYTTAFLFKLLPVLEYQKPGGGLALLKRINAESIVVTYPLKSLGGKEKGMGVNYADAFEKLVSFDFRIAAQARIGNELVYIIRRRSLNP